MSELVMPRYSLSQVATLRSSIWEFLRPFVSSKIHPGIDYESLIVSLLERLPSGVDRQTLTESLYDLVGCELTRDKARLVAYRLAGNMATLKAGKPVLPWRQQPEPEWVPFEFTDARSHITKAGKRGLIFTFMALAGSPAGVAGTAFWGSKFCYVMSEPLGFTKSWGKHPLAQGNQMVGMQLYGLIDANSCIGGELKFTNTHCASAMISHNKELLAARVVAGRETGANKCPYSFGHECHQCFVGRQPHAKDNRMCALAAHGVTYEFGRCLGCGNDRFLNPATHVLGKPLCESCRLEGILRKVR